ncbi:DeoR/GlpR family transcriptional regulator [Aeromonas hydrophila]|uniref:DeoR/GlpR family transcriptional regulator n=1 Tax=Aeromonas hydrophila TaxID=644 RepID=UPI0011178F57|nr:DeoR/GlpR family transcriptional regulator [Aeromonas hydrophila]TNH71512.1 DeoR/GlpR family transcriptional regulator [Aeromonas hydrophila]
MKQTQRHLEILDVLTRQGFVSTEDLVTHFDVSPQTIRRDLNDLAEQNKIRRHHGGASLHSSTVNTAYSARKVMQLKEKERIAREVAANIPDGSSLFIDIGTTTEAIARALLDHRELRIVTNNLNVASILTAKDDFTVIIAGGEIRNRDGGIVGEATRDFIGQFRMDYGVIGISGIDSDGSLLDFDYHEVKIAQAIIAHSRQVFLAADHTKFGRNAMVNLGNLSQIHSLFTDQEPPEKLMRLMSQHQIECHIC